MKLSSPKAECMYINDQTLTVRSTLSFTLQAMLPLAMVAGSPNASRRQRCHFILLSASGLYGLWPLLYRAEEYLPKALMSLAYIVVAVQALLPSQPIATSRLKHAEGPTEDGAMKGPWQRGFYLLERIYLWGFIPIELYCSFGHGAVLGSRLPFLPLLLTSLYCALGNSWVWLCMASSYVQEGRGGY